MLSLNGNAIKDTHNSWYSSMWYSWLCLYYLLVAILRIWQTTLHHYSVIMAFLILFQSERPSKLSIFFFLSFSFSSSSWQQEEEECNIVTLTCYKTSNIISPWFHTWHLHILSALLDVCEAVLVLRWHATALQQNIADSKKTVCHKWPKVQNASQ